MELRFTYYLLNGVLYALDNSNEVIVYFKDDDWHEECNMLREELASNTTAIVIDEAQAMEKANGLNPEQYVEEILEQDMYKNIYCP